MKSPISIVARIKKSGKIEPWCKRFFLFMHSWEVQFNWSDIVKWNKAALWNKTVMTQKLISTKKAYVAICSFVVVAERQLPQMQGDANKALSTLNASLKKYGAIVWFIVIENKVFVILNVFNTTKLLKDIETRQIHSIVIKSLGADLGRTNPRFKGINSLEVTFCPSDTSEIERKSEVVESNENLPIKVDRKLSSHNNKTQAEKIAPSIVNQPEIIVSNDAKPSYLRTDSQVGKAAPFKRNQPVEVFSNTSGYWVKARVFCVQEDSDGIFVTVRRIDGHELDYDIKNVRAVMAESNPSDNSPDVPKGDAIREKLIYSPNESAQRDDFEIGNEPDAEYSEKEYKQEQIADAARDSFIPENKHKPSAYVMSDAEWFKRIETFYVVDKIRTINRWLYRRIEENEQLPVMITEKLQEISKMVKNYNNGL